MYRVLRKRHHIADLPTDNLTYKGLHCPWIDETEWKAVCSWLYGTSPAERKKGVERVAAWRGRGTVPFPVECTADIVQCLLTEEEESSWQSTNESTSLVMAMLITRFVNGVFDYGCLLDISKESRTIHGVVNELGVPLWLVTLRHDSTHRVLPSHSLLMKGIQFIKKWLWNNYWQPQYSILPVSDTTALVQQIPSFWHESSPPSLPSSSTALHNVDTTEEQVDNLKTSLRQYYLNTSDRQQLIRKLYKSLANLDHKMFLRLLKSQLFLSTQENITELYEGKVARFPMLTSSSKSQWEPLLRSMGRYRSCAKTQLLHALIKACHSQSDDVNELQSLQLSSAAWLGLLLQSTRGTISQDQSTNNTYIEVDLTVESGLMAGDIQCELLLTVSRDYPGPYTCAINERLLQLMPDEPKLNYEKLLHFSILLSISEGISSTSTSTTSLCGSFPMDKEGKYSKKLSELKEKLTDKRKESFLIEDNNRMETEEERESLWKKANGLDWYRTPLGCVPGQQLTPLSLDLPYEAENNLTISTTSGPTTSSFTPPTISIEEDPSIRPQNDTTTAVMETVQSSYCLEDERDKRDGECSRDLIHDSEYLQSLQQAIVLY